MATVLEEYFPFASGAGSNVSEDEWRTMAEQWLPSGVVDGQANEFAVAQRAAGANMSVDVATGQARIQGIVGVSSTLKNQGIAANATGNPRIDRVILRADFTAKVIELDVLTGTPAAVPVEPALTQNSAIWEIALARIAVAAGAVSIVTANITDERTINTPGGGGGADVLQTQVFGN